MTETQTSPAPARREALLAALVVTLGIYLFHVLGNASNVDMEGRSLFAWIGRQLIVRGGDFSHGWIIPLVSLALVWWRRRALREAPKSVSAAGLAVVAGALALHALALRAQQPRLSLVALTALLWGIPYFVYGPAVARVIRFPCAYLLLSFTAYVLVYFSFPLRLFSCVLASGLLNGMGIATERVGTALHATAGGGFHFDVADPCSGLRSLFVMTALAAPYAYLTQRTPLRQWALFLLSVPLAMLSNTFRIVTVALAAQAFGQQFALTVYHDYSGYIVFTLSIVLLTAAGALVARVGARPGGAA